MGENTKIEWARHTFNPWVGCTRLAHPKGSACDFCYAAAWAKRTGHPELWEGERRRTTESNWKQPIKWDAAAKAAGERHTVFCASLADVFDNQVDPQWRTDLFALIRATPNLVWLLLTKRPENIIKMAEAAGGLPANAALGSTVEDQTRANHRVPHLLRAKSELQPLFVFLSCEPLIGAVDLWLYLDPMKLFRSRLDWVIAGGESGGKARPSHPAWFRSLRDQCSKAGAAFHFKQWGEWLPGHQYTDELRARDSNLIQSRYACMDWVGDKPFETEAIGGWDYTGDDAVWRVGKKSAGRLLDGREHNDLPNLAAKPLPGSDNQAGLSQSDSAMPKVTA